MSMINDALRRASSGASQPPDQSGTPTPPPLPSYSAAPEPAGYVIPPGEGLPPVLQPGQSKKNNLPLLLLALLLFCLAGVAGVYLWEKNHRKALPRQNEDGQTLAADVEVTAPAAASQTSPEPALAKAEAPAAAPASASPKPAPASVAPGVASVPSTAALAAAPTQFPQLRLQSIFYRMSNPSVMINGRTFYVNDQVQGVTVASIDPASVTLVLSGRTNVLTLR
jgi:hypothetical protein